MTSLIKIFFFLIFFNSNISIAETVNNKILFKLNNKVFTNIDLEKRIQYIGITNNLNSDEINNLSEEKIIDDYLSALIYNEYYIDKRINFPKLNKERESLFEINISEKEIIKEFNKEEINNLKYNLKLDLIRKKIIESSLNSNKNELIKKATLLDLLYNYNLSYLTIKNKYINKAELLKITNRESFNNFNNKLLNNGINVLFKNEDINESSKISELIKTIIRNNDKIYFESKNKFITIYSLEKNLESFDGIFVKLVNFSSIEKIKEENINCNNVKEISGIKKTIYKEYQYKKLNNKIKKNLKSINDFIIYKNDNNYNYIILCELRYDENILNEINFNKKIEWLADKIQINFLNKYRNEYQYQNFK